MKLKILIVFLLQAIFMNAQVPFSQNGIDYITDINSTAKIVGSDCSQENLTFPTTVIFQGENYDVIQIGANAFSNCTSLKNVTFPSSITFIGNNAFSGCTALEKVDVPNTVSAYGGGVFSGCTSLTEANINSTANYVNASTFKDCTSLTTVTFPATVTTIAKDSFNNCTSLTSINLPTSLDFLGESAFENSGLTSIDLPSITTIQKRAFLGTKIVSIDIPASFTSVPESFLSNCDELVTVNLPNSILSIDKGAFSSCGKLTSINLPSSLRTIDVIAFSGSSLTSIILPDTVTEIGAEAFRDSRDLTNVTFSASLQTIGSNAFQRCDQLQNFTLPNSLREIGVRTFEQCFDLTEVIIPNSVTNIGAYAFNRCLNLESVQMSNSLTALNQFVFNECRKLDAIEIPSTVTSISDFAFAKTRLRKVTVDLQTPLPVNANVFEDITLAFAELTVPAGTIASYEAADVWKDFGSIIESVPTVINIPDSNFEQALVDKSIDSDGVVNGQVLESDIINIETLDVSSRFISDLTGIQGFKNLETLFVQDNNIETIDLSGNTALSGLLIAFNNLSSIDLSNNTSLISISLNNNTISSIDLSNNLLLEQVYINNNTLTAIDLSMLSNLKELDVSVNELVELDVSGNSSLNIVFCQNNNLANLNIQNGNNANVIDNNFDASFNENLFCIQVDDVNFSNTNWINIDDQSSFGLDCAPENDGCAEATPLTLGALFNGTNISATSSNAVPNCQQEGLILLDVWFEFEAPESASVFIAATSLSGIVKFAIYEDCNSTIPIACSANDLLQDNLTVGQTYFIQLWIEADISSGKSSVSKQSQSLNQQTGAFTINVQDSNSLSTEDIQLDTENIKVFPNPAVNNINVTSFSNIDYISIYNVLGKEVYFDKNINNKTSYINLNHLGSGLYIINIKTSNNNQSKKLIIK